VGGFLLAVNEGDAEGGEGLDEGDKGQFRGVGAASEHAFTEKHPSEAQAIEAPYEDPLVEGLDAVREAEVVQGDIGLLHFPGEPSAVLSGPRGRGAGEDKVFKASVHAEEEGGFKDIFP